jgi:hypothetical protein
MPEHDPPRSQELAARMRVDAADKAARDEAGHVVERWNRHIASDKDVWWWSPTILTATVAGMPWAEVYCPGCKTTRSIDIRTLDRHPLASVGALVLFLRCTWCRGSAPMPKILGLHASPPVIERKGAIERAR